MTELNNQTTISISLAVALLGVVVSGSIWLGQVSARMDQVERQIELLGPTSERLIRVEVQLKSISSTVERIENRLEERNAQ